MEGINQIYYCVAVGEEKVILEKYDTPNSPSVNLRHQILEEYDQDNYFRGYLKGEHQVFETAVLNLLSLAGYSVQWFGDNNYTIPNHSRNVARPQYKEIDVIAHAPDDSRVLFVECVTQYATAKSDFLDRFRDISSAIEGEGRSATDSSAPSGPQMTPCLAVAQPREEIPDQKLQELEEQDVEILDQDRLLDIYDRAALQSDYIQLGPGPGIVF